jgi:tRNA C32,U32 (ribose-2'-O)-methylase TrmJ
MQRENIIFVLDHTRNSENIGLAARAMANFGFTRLRLVAPEHLDKAERVARHGGGVVAKAEIFETLEQALSDLTLVLATTGLKELVGEEPLLPGPAAGLLAASRHRLDRGPGAPGRPHLPGAHLARLPQHEFEPCRGPFRLGAQPGRR